MSLIMETLKIYEDKNSIYGRSFAHKYTFYDNYAQMYLCNPFEDLSDLYQVKQPLEKPEFHNIRMPCS